MKPTKAQLKKLESLKEAAKLAREAWDGYREKLAAGHQAAFEFHHKDNNKEFALGNVGNKSWGVAKKEMLKCELLCSNCHRIHHSNRDSKEFLEAANNYKGALLF